MKILDINDENVLLESTNILMNGSILMHPTETCYGLACDIFNEKAVLKLYSIKEMEIFKPSSVLVSDLETAMEYVEFGELALSLAKKYWPGPLSLVLPRKAKVPEFFNPGERFLSIRVPSNEFSLKLTKDFASAVLTTSANPSGEMQMYFVNNEKFPEFLNKIDLIVDGGLIPENKPSTIIKIENEKMILLRQGELFVEGV